MNIAHPYLGKPGGMWAIPLPTDSDPIQAPPSRNEITTVLLSGGTSVSRSLSVKRSYVITNSSADPDVADIFQAFHSGLFGPGPFVLVDSTVRNMLPLDQSTMGMRPGSVPGWTATGGTVNPDASAPPAGVVSGVLAWNLATTGLTIKPGTSGGVADATSAPVYLPEEFVSVGIWLKASAAISCALAARTFDASDGTSIANLTSKSVSVTTDWQWFTVTAAPGAGSGDLVLPRVAGPSSMSGFPVLYMAGAQVEYADAATAFQAGYGSPRVLVTSGTGRSVSAIDCDGTPISSATLNLAEV